MNVYIHGGRPCNFMHPFGIMCMWFGPVGFKYMYLPTRLFEYVCFLGQYRAKRLCFTLLRLRSPCQVVHVLSESIGFQTQTSIHYFPAYHSKHSTPLHAIQYSLVNCM